MNTADRRAYRDALTATISAITEAEATLNALFEDDLEYTEVGRPSDDMAAFLGEAARALRATQLINDTCFPGAEPTPKTTREAAVSAVGRSNILLIGPPKSGRTTTLRELLHRAAENDLAVWLVDPRRSINFQTVPPLVVDWRTPDAATIVDMITEVERLLSVRTSHDKRNRVVLFAVADAQTLPPDVLDRIDSIADDGPVHGIFVIKEVATADGLAVVGRSDLYRQWINTSDLI